MPTYTCPKCMTTHTAPEVKANLTPVPEGQAPQSTKLARTDDGRLSYFRCKKCLAVLFDGFDKKG